MIGIRTQRKPFRVALLLSVAAHLALLFAARAPDTTSVAVPPPEEKMKIEMAVMIPEPEPIPPPTPRKKRTAPKPAPTEQSPSEQPSAEVPAEPTKWEVPQPQRRTLRTAPQRTLRPSQVDLSLPTEPRKPDTIPPLWKSESWEPAGIGIATAGTRDTLGNTLPDYPLELRHAGKPGMVEIAILIDTVGKVEDALPMQIRGNLKFANSVVRAVKGWEDLPTMRDSTGTKVWYWVRKKFFFGTQEGDPIHNFKGLRRNLHEQVPEEKDYGKMLYEHIYNYK